MINIPNCKIIVMNRLQFINMCQTNSWTDFTVDLVNDAAFISISDINSPQPAVFNFNHPNVLNLNFDDVGCDISSDIATTIVNFIEGNLGKTFYIHCNAGISRSGAVGKFIESSYDGYRNSIYNEGKLRPNMSVLTSLKRVLWSRKFQEN